MLKKLFWILLTIVLILATGLFLFYRSLLPKYNGTIKLPLLTSETEVYYDDNGIPHILAGNNLDAMRALGYVHAQDRLFQMDLLSRIGAGRLSELFGETTIEADKFYLTLGIDKHSRELVKNQDTTGKAYREAMAYLEGVNYYVEHGKTPVEFRLLGVDKRAFTLKDIFNVYGYMAFSFAAAHKSDPLMSVIQEQLGQKYIENIPLHIDPKTTLIPTYDKSNAIGLSKQVAAIQSTVPVPAFQGSNSWVIAPEKTKNGKVIFENDPHIAFGQPATWFQAHIKTPETESYGFYLALNPFPLLAHNRQLAYGLTMFTNDDIDLYAEQNHPENENQYLLGNDYKDYNIYNYNIAVKDSDSVPWTVRENHRGPIMTDVLPNRLYKHPISMYWVYTQRPAKLLEITYTMSRAKDFKTFSQGPPLLHAPGLNIMYGDVAGNVAWWASGQLFKRQGNPSTKMLLDGTKTDNDLIDYRPFSENPKSINPPWHYVYSCNNQPDDRVSGYYVPGYYLPEDRGKRVVELLKEKNDWTQKDVEHMALDDTSSVNGALNHILVLNIDPETLNDTEKQAWTILKQWDAKAAVNSVGMTIFNQFVYEFYKVMLYDELGEELFIPFMGTNSSKYMFEPLFRGQYAIWTDDISTPDHKEILVEMHQKAFKNAVAKLERHFNADPETWTWGKVHTLEHKHPLGAKKVLRPYFNVGPYPVSGGKRLLNNLTYSYTDDIPMLVSSGPSTRRIIDFSNVENAVAISPTGNSGNPLSPYYKDQADKYVKGEYVPMLINEEAIRALKNKLTLTP